MKIFPGWRSRHPNLTVDKMSVVKLAFFCLYYGIHIPLGLGSEDEERLVRDLFQGYNKLIRPVQNKTQHMNVKFGMALIQLINVNELNQILKSNVWLRLIWQDYQLIWDPADYGNIKTLRISYHMIWTPDIVLFNNADGKYEVSTKCNVVLGYTGEVLWVPPSIYKSTCIMDVRYFPFDEQHCTMKFGSWTFNGDEVGFSFYDDKEYVDLNDYSTSGTWDIINVPGYLNVDNRTRPTRTDVTFHLHIRRKTLFYTVNLLAPCIMMSFMSVLVFYLPPDGNEKITLGISILLAIVLFQLVVAKILPPTSVCIPLISKYLLFTFVVNLICVLVSLIIVNWNFRDGAIQPIPSILRSIFLDFLPKYLFMKRPVLVRPSQSQSLLKSMSRLNVDHVDAGPSGMGAAGQSVPFGQFQSMMQDGTSSLLNSKTKLIDRAGGAEGSGVGSSYNKLGKISVSITPEDVLLRKCNDFMNHALVNEQKPPDQKLQVIMALRRRQQLEEDSSFYESTALDIGSYPGPHHQIQTFENGAQSAKPTFEKIAGMADSSLGFRNKSTHKGANTTVSSSDDIRYANIHSPGRRNVSHKFRTHAAVITPPPLPKTKRSKSRSPALSLKSMGGRSGGTSREEPYKDDLLLIYQYQRSAQNLAQNEAPTEFALGDTMPPGGTITDQPSQGCNPCTPIRGELNLGFSTSSDHKHRQRPYIGQIPVDDSWAVDLEPSAKPRHNGLDVRPQPQPSGPSGPLGQVVEGVTGAAFLKRRTFKVSNDGNKSSSSCQKNAVFKVSSSSNSRSSSFRSRKHWGNDGTSKDAAIQAMAKNVVFVADHLRSEDEGVMAKEDWKYIAIVMDRLLLYIFVIVSLAGTIGIIIGAPHIFEYVDQTERIQFLTGKKSE